MVNSVSMQKYLYLVLARKMVPKDSSKLGAQITSSDRPNRHTDFFAFGMCPKFSWKHLRGFEGENSDLWNAP